MADGRLLPGFRFLPEEVLYRVVPQTSPAAGSEFTVTVPGGFVWVLLTLYAILVTDATVANRRLRYEFSDGSNVFARIPARSSQPASTTERYTLFADGANETEQGSTHVFGLPSRIVLLPGWTITSASASLQAADQYSGIVALVEERALRGDEPARAAALAVAADILDRRALNV